MEKYIKIQEPPVEVVCWDGTNFEELKSFCPRVVDLGFDCAIDKPKSWPVNIPLRVGWQSAQLHDYIIKHPEGYYYAMRPSEFVKKYQPAAGDMVEDAKAGTDELYVWNGIESQLDEVNSIEDLKSWRKEYRDCRELLQDICNLQKAELEKPANLMPGVSIQLINCYDRARRFLEKYQHQ